MLRLRRIDFIQFDDREAGENLPGLYSLLQRYSYSLFRFIDGKLQLCMQPTHREQSG